MCCIFFYCIAYKVVLLNDQNEQHLRCVTTLAAMHALLFYTRCESAVGCGCVSDVMVQCVVKSWERFCQLLQRCQPKQIISFHLAIWDDKLTPRGLRDEFFLFFTPTIDYATARNLKTFGINQPELPLFFSVQNVTPVILLYFFFHVACQHVSSLDSVLRKSDPLLFPDSDGAHITDILGCYGEIRDTITPLWVQNVFARWSHCRKKMVRASLKDKTCVFY